MVNKSIWGPLTWCLFHSLAFKLKPGYDHMVPLLFAYIKGICVHLPCPDCAYHAQIMWQNYPYHVYTKEDLVKALWRAHNVVNRRLGKPIMSRQDHDNLYVKIPLFEVCNKYRSVMSATERSEQRLTDAFYRKRKVEDFMRFIRNNWAAFDR